MVGYGLMASVAVCIVIILILCCCQGLLMSFLKEKFVRKDEPRDIDGTEEINEPML